MNIFIFFVIRFNLFLSIRDINHLKTQVHSIEVADEEYTLQIEEIIAEVSIKCSTT